MSDLIGQDDKSQAEELERSKVLGDIQDGTRFLVSKLEGESYEEWWTHVVVIGGKLYENHASHCSCDNFDGQWDPEPTSLKYLLSKYCWNLSFLSDEDKVELSRLAKLYAPGCEILNMFEVKQAGSAGKGRMYASREPAERDAAILSKSHGDTFEVIEVEQ